MAKLDLIHGVDTVDNYPYGRLRCTRTMKVEFKKGYGYRISTQTINPKTGRLNAPKNGTYYPLIILHRDPETGYATGLHFNLNSIEQIQKLAETLRANPDLKFSVEESQEIWANIIACIKTTAEWAKFRIPEAGEQQTAIQFLEAVDLKGMIKHYGNKDDIKALAESEINYLKTFLSFEDKENGQACKEWRITSRASA